MTPALRIGQRWHTARTTPQDAGDPCFTCGWATITALDSDGVKFRAKDETTHGDFFGNGNWLKTDEFRATFPTFMEQVFTEEPDE